MLLAGRQHGLFADHAFSPYFLNPTCAIGDDPVPRQQLGSSVAGIADRDVIGKSISPRIWTGLIGQKLGCYGNFDRMWAGGGHVFKAWRLAVD